MYLAVVNNSTNKVDNVVVPPIVANTWFAPAGYTVVETETGAIGDIYENGEFIKPEPVESDEP